MGRLILDLIVQTAQAHRLVGVINASLQQKQAEGKRRRAPPRKGGSAGNAEARDGLDRPTDGWVVNDVGEVIADDDALIGGRAIVGKMEGIGAVRAAVIGACGRLPGIEGRGLTGGGVQNLRGRPGVIGEIAVAERVRSGVQAGGKGQGQGEGNRQKGATSGHWFLDRGIATNKFKAHILFLTRGLVRL